MGAAENRASRGAGVIDALASRRPRIWRPSERREQIKKLWKDGLPPGDLTGWTNVNQLYTVVPGQMTIVTGWPGAGKSEWVDALMVNLALDHGWRFAIYSPENQPIDLHITKVMEKVRDKPFGRGPSERIAADDLDPTLDQLDAAFSFMDSASGGLAVQDIITAAAPHLGEEGKRGLIIDPFNELEHWRPSGMSETEYVSQFLSTVRNWARQTNIHVWIVAHPQKMRRDVDGKLPVPKPDMISGSQHWWNKADACITVWRDMSPLALQPHAVIVYVQKIRFKHVGRTGEAQLYYDRVTGRYSESEHFNDSGVRF